MCSYSSFSSWCWTACSTPLVFILARWVSLSPAKCPALPCLGACPEAVLPFPVLGLGAVCACMQTCVLVCVCACMLVALPFAFAVLSLSAIKYWRYRLMLINYSQAILPSVSPCHIVMYSTSAQQQFTELSSKHQHNQPQARQLLTLCRTDDLHKAAQQTPLHTSCLQ